MTNNSNEITDETLIDLTKLSPSLIKHFTIDCNFNSNIITDWKPPDKYGLQNSPQIIPLYYFNNKNKNMLDIDYYNIIIDDIRNLRKLNKYQLKFIKKIDDKHKMKLFIEFNKLFDILHTLL